MKKYSNQKLKTIEKYNLVDCTREEQGFGEESTEEISYTGSALGGPGVR